MTILFKEIGIGKCQKWTILALSAPPPFAYFQKFEVGRYTSFFLTETWFSVFHGSIIKFSQKFKNKEIRKIKN